MVNIIESIRSAHAEWEENADWYEAAFSGRRAKSKIRLQLAAMAASSVDGKSMEDVFSMCVEQIEKSGIWDSGSGYSKSSHRIMSELCGH